MTVEWFANMSTPETEDYELVDGELIPLSSGTFRHAKVRGRLERLTNSYFDRNQIGEAFGEVDCRVSPDTVRRPDLSIFLGERLRQIDLDKIPAPFAPDIAVEVLSPSESAVEVRRKVRDYLSAGSHEVWLLDPLNGEVLVYTGAGIRLLQGAEVLKSPLLPGFSAVISALVSGL